MDKAKRNQIYSSMRKDRLLDVALSNACNVDELIEALEDVKSKLDDYFAGRINIRPDFLAQVNQALARTKEE